MNISINFAKTAAVGAILLLAFSAFIANAAVTLTNATFAGDSNVETSESVTVNVSATKTGGQCENNWNFTRITVTGADNYEEVYTSTPFWGDAGTPTGSGKSSDAVTFNAPSVAGDYDVLVEIVGGGEIFGDTDCDNSSFGIPNWPTTQTLELTVYEPVAADIRVIDINNKNAERPLDGTIQYTAEIVVEGYPDYTPLQCVVFDIYNSDGWQTVSVTDNGTGTYYVDSPVYDLTTANGFAYNESPYDVIAIALDVPCDDVEYGDSNGWTTDTYHDDANSDDDAETQLFLVEPQAPTYCVTGSVWNDTDHNGELADGELFSEGWEVTISDSEGVVYDTTTTNVEGGYELCAPAGNWIIKQISPEGWTYSYPSDGQWEITLPFVPVVDLTFLDQVINFFVPTAHAAVAQGVNNLNFGVFQRAAAYSQGSYGGGGNGRNISLRDDDDDDSSSDDDNDDNDEPEGQVLGEATSAMPVGAPATGAGGASPLSLDLNTLVAILASRSRKE